MVRETVSADDTKPLRFSADVVPPMPIDQMFAQMMNLSGMVTVGREEALSVPAVQQGLHVIRGEISTLPLVQTNSRNKRVRSRLLEQIDPDVPNVVTIAQTVQDIILEAGAYWRIIEFDREDWPLHAQHIEFTKVTLQPPGDRGTPDPLPGGVDPRGATVWIDGDPVPWDQIIYFPSPNPPLRKVAGRVIKRALLLDRAAAMYAEEPRPMGILMPEEPGVVWTDDERADITNQWRIARQTRGTAVMSGVKWVPVDMMSPADLQLADLQKQACLDIANAFGLDPEDFGISTTSRTYQNAVDRRQDRINGVLAPYMRAITDRLSMGDVTRRGHRVLFDLDDYMKADPRTRWDVYKTQHELMGDAVVPEIREREGLPPLDGAQPAPEKPAATVAASRVALSDDTEATELTFADLPLTKVNKERRTITGLAVPFNQSAINQRRRWQFLPDSLEYADLGRVKLLRDHDWSQALGKAVELAQTPEGYLVTLKVARGPEGDKALALAEDGAVDGLSINVDILDAIPDPNNPGVMLVRRALLREVSLTARPAFDDSRVTAVAASRDEGTKMTDATTEPQAPAAPADAPGLTFNMDELVDKLAARMAVKPADEPEKRQPLNQTRVAMTAVTEALPYRFDRGGNFVPTEHNFSADLHSMARARDEDGTRTDAGKRVMGLLQATFATTSADVNELNPTINRPDLYVDERQYRTPLWDFVNKGSLPNGVQPFMFPKFASASGLVGDHTEGVEPDAGSFTTTSQTVTPTPLSGKASLPREVWDMGGNPAVSTLIFNQMKRGYRRGLETATATFLNTLTAATDISLPVAATDEALAAAWDAALADLQFVQDYDFSAFAIEKVLYKAFVAARDTSGRVLYPIIAPQNANGTAQTRFRTLDLGGVTGVPAQALASTAGSPNNSWLFDPTTVHGWATAPQRLEFPGTAADGSYAPVAMVDIAIWGYKAFANSDLGGVRQVIYDNAA